MVIGTYILITTLNVNGINAPTKRHRLAEWIQKQNPYICCLQEMHFRPRDTYRLKEKGWKNTVESLRRIWDTTKQINIYTMGVLETEERKRGRNLNQRNNG